MYIGNLENSKMEVSPTLWNLPTCPPPHPPMPSNSDSVNLSLNPETLVKGDFKVLTPWETLI